MKTVAHSAIGAGIGFLAGCALGLGRTAVTLTCPVLWIPGDAAAFGCAAYNLSEGNIPVTATAAVAGAIFGVGELVAYPVTAPLSLAMAATFPVVGTISGAVIGGLHGAGKL